MRRIVLELTRASIRVLAVEGTPAQPRIRKFIVVSLAGLTATPEASQAGLPAAPGAAQAGELNRESLRQALAGLQPARAVVITTIPRDQVITRLLKLPSVQPDELARMVELSGKAQLPYPPNQAVVGFSVLEQDAGTSQVQLVACHRDLVERSLRLFREEGVEPAWLVPSSWGCLAWYERLGRSPEVREPVLVLNVDADHTDLVLVQRGRLVFSRSLSQGLHEWQTSPDAVDALVQELERSLSSLRKEWPGVDANSLLLTGLGPLEQWKGVFEQRLNKPVIVKSAQGSLRLSASGDVAAVSPTVVLGLAMAEPQWLVNLVPPEARQAQRHRRRMRELAVTGVLVLAALLLGAGWLGVHVDRQARFTQQAGGALQQLESVTAELEQKERNTQLIQRVLASRRAIATVLVELFRLTPPEVLFESVVFERARGELVVRGSAPETGQVLEYVRGLEQSAQWDRVELRYSARRSVGSEARTDFELLLRCRLS